MNAHENKTGPLHDDELKKRMQGELKSGHSTRAREEREPEPPGEDQPAASRSPYTPLSGATPPGMTPEDVQLRTELAQHLGRSVYPADRARVLDTLREHHAPDRLIDTAAELPEGQKYGNVQDIVRTLGRGGE